MICMSKIQKLKKVPSHHATFAREHIWWVCQVIDQLLWQIHKNSGYFCSPRFYDWKRLIHFEKWLRENSENGIYAAQQKKNTVIEAREIVNYLFCKTIIYLIAFENWRF